MQSPPQLSVLMLCNPELASQLIIRDRTPRFICPYVGGSRYLGVQGTQVYKGMLPVTVVDFAVRVLSKSAND